MSEQQDPAAATVLEAYLGEQVDAIAAGAMSLHQGRDAVHPTRVATRRVRSLLRVFVDLFDGEAAAALDRELAWYAGVLGAVRERQVLRARLSGMGDAAETGGPAAYADGDALTTALDLIDRRLCQEEGSRRAELIAALDGDRYRALAADLSRWASAPPLAPAATGAAEELRRYVRAAGRAADKRLARATARPEDVEALHSARKAAKRARYAAEVARSVLGEKAAKRSLDHYKSVQEALGEHQDSADAVSTLHRLRAEAGDDAQLTAAYDALLERERTAARNALTQAITFVH